MSIAPAAASREAVPAPGLRAAVLLFLAFALAYFASALVRAITATLSPVLTAEFSLQAGDLGLLAGGFFLGFASTQLPLGTWLDRHGPKRVVLAFMAVAVLGCLAFSWAGSFATLLAARVLLGMGLSACLMAPLTGFRRWYEPSQMLRANSWMLMVGSLGMVASTLPVQWLMPLTGWRALFWLLAALLLVAMALIARWVPAWETAPQASGQALAASPGYGQIWRSRGFLRVVPLALFNYGGMIGLQTLWAGPWMTRVTGLTPLQAATGLFCLNLGMLLAFWCWGLVTPRLFRAGWSVERLLRWGTPLSLAVLVINIAAGSQTGWLGWALFCVLSSVISLAQPAVGMMFPPALAGRALSAYNLVIFLGIFIMQWCIGLMVDALKAWGWGEVAAFQGAFAAYLCCCLAAYAVFMRVPPDNPRP